MTNPRFIDLAKRQRDEGFLEAEAKRAEEARTFLEEEERRSKEEIRRARIAKLESLQAEQERKGEFKQYVSNLNGFEGNELETAFYAFVNHPDFPRIHNQLQTLSTVNDKWAFLLRRAYEIGDEVEIHIGHLFSTLENHLGVKKRLEDYGISLLCPYFRENKDQVTREECLIDGETVMSLCQGRYDICAVFKDRTEKAALGDISLPVVTRTQSKVQIPKIEVEPVDVRDLNDWWRMEGKYS